jgi:hypothetical protein
MKHGWAALALSVLALGAFAPRSLDAQEPSANPPPRERTPGFELGQNYPNPFNPTTTIPFMIGDPPTCTEAGRLHRVTLRVYNMIGQLVSVPILQGDPAPGEPVQNLSLPCGSYTAFWNGKYLNTSQEVASGVYLYKIEVDGKVFAKKMLVTK